MQKALFEIVKKSIPVNIRMVDLLSDLLTISTDAVYRRIRGEKELTLSELRKICVHFNISLDAIIHMQSGNVVFRHFSLDLSKMDTYYHYLESFHTTIEQLSAAEEAEIIFAADDIPIFHLLPYYELSVFKVYTWYQAVTNISIPFEEFMEQQVDKSYLLKMYDQLWKSQNKIPSTEIWTDTTIEPILKLMEYYNDLGCIRERETLHLLCNQLLELINNLSEMTERQKKINSKAPYNFYLSPVSTENSFLIAKSRDNISATVKMYTINSIVTTNEQLCRETEKWLQATMQKSSFLSGASARERFKFFQKMKSRINFTLENMDAGR